MPPNMLYTNLFHLETANELGRMIDENESVMVIYGKMDPVSVSAYRLAETLEKEFPAVKFCDMESDNPESATALKELEPALMPHIPLMVYYQDGKAAGMTSGYQTKEVVTFNIKELFLKTLKI
jgi:thioredoxin 1